MAVREHEAIAIGPERILRIEPHHAVPDGVNQRRQRHGRARVSGLGLLHGIHGKRTDGVDAQLVEIRAYVSFRNCSHFNTSSRAATLASRRRCRSAWLNSAARYASTRS